MSAATEQSRPLHPKAQIVLKEIIALLEECGQNKSTDCLRLEININQGVPSRLTRCTEMRRNIPLEETH